MAKLYQHVREKKNDLGHRMTIENCENLIRLYQKARAAGCSHAKACSYAISTRKAGACHSGNRERQGLKNGPDPKKMRTYKWWSNSTTINTSPERFKSLLIKSLGAMPNLKAKNVKREIVEAMKKAQHPTYLQAMKAQANIKAVLGKRFRYNIWFWLIASNTRREWMRVKRGKDLFIKGWGSFDINKVAKDIPVPVGKIDDTQGDEYSDNPVNWEYDRWAIPSVLNIQAKGYGIGAHHLERLRAKHAKWAMEYVTRHKDWWFAANNRRRVDELFYGGQYLWDRAAGQRGEHVDTDAEVLLRANPHLRPEELLARVAELMEEHQDEVFAGYDLDFKGSFDWVKDLPALPVSAGPVPDGSQLVPLRSGEECKEVGKKLHNCVASYGLSIFKKEVMLVALIAPDGKPLGVGECWWNDREKRLEWGDRLGPCNEDLDPTVEALFAEYTPIASGACWTKEKPRLKDNKGAEVEPLVLEGRAVQRFDEV